MKDSILKFFDNAWTITLISTMIGVYAGIYVNDYFDQQALLADKEKAFQDVINEIKENHDILVTYDSLLRHRFNGIKYVFSKVNDDNKIIISQDSLESFKSRIDSVFIVEGTEKVGNNWRIRGELNLHIHSPLIARGLSSIIWESYKQTAYLNHTGFKCLTEMEVIYHLQDEVNRLNDEWIDSFIAGTFYRNAELREDFLSVWNQLLTRQHMLLKVFRNKHQMIETCDS